MTAVVVEPLGEGITKLTLNRPERLNAMNSELVAQLYAALDEIGADRSCRVVVLTGAGRGFCCRPRPRRGGDPTRFRERRGRRDRHAACRDGVAEVDRRARCRHASAAATDRRRGQRRGVGRRPCARARVRRADRGSERALQRGVREDRPVGLRRRRVVVAAAPRRRVACLRDDVDRAARRGRGGGAHRPRRAHGTRRPAARRRARHGSGDRREQPVRGPHDEGGHVEPTRDRSLQAGIDLENRTQILSTFTGDIREAAAAFLEKRPPVFGDL